MAVIRDWQGQPGATRNSVPGSLGWPTCAEASPSSSWAAPTLLPISLDTLDITQARSYIRCGLSHLASVMSCLSGVHLAHCMPQDGHTMLLFTYSSDD